MSLKKKIVYYLSLMVLSPSIAFSDTSGSVSLEESSSSSIIIRTPIRATREKVWEVMADFKNYGVWNGWVGRIDGDAKEGATVHAYGKSANIKLDLKITSLQKPHAICWTDVTWFTHFGLGGWRCRTIEDLADGSGVMFTNHFVYTGPFKWALRFWTREGLVKGMTLENESLRDYVENKQTSNNMDELDMFLP